MLVVEEIAAGPGQHDATVLEHVTTLGQGQGLAGVLPAEGDGGVTRGGTAVRLVRQNPGQALALAGGGYVLENGGVVLTGAGRDLLDNEHVQRAYLGM